MGRRRLKWVDIVFKCEYPKDTVKSALYLIEDNRIKMNA